MRNDELETLIKQSITANIKPEASIKRGPKAEVPLSRKRYGKGDVSCFIHMLVVIPFLEAGSLLSGETKYTTFHEERQPIPPTKKLETAVERGVQGHQLSRYL